MEMKDRLQTARKKAGKTQAEVARQFGVTPQAVSAWERGDAVPENDKLLPLAQLYGVQTDWLLGRDGFAEETPNFRPPPEFFGERDLKVFAAVEGGPGEMVVSTDPIDLVPRPWYLGSVRDGFAVLVVGDSMVPRFEPGELAIVNPRLPPQRNEDVILIGGEDEGEFRASIKRLLSWDAKNWRLQQFNPPRELTWSRKDWPKALRVVGKYRGG